MSGARGFVIVRATMLALLACVAACKSEKARTEVMLEIDADTEVRARLDTLRILVDVSDDDGESWQKRLTQSFGRDDVGDWRAFAWPARLGLVPEGDKVDRKFAVRVQALDRAGALYVWQQAAAGFERGRTQVLRVTLSASCMVDALDCGDPQCVGTKDCQTCRSGECVSVQLLKLEDFDPKVKSDAGMLLDDAGGNPDRDSGEREQPEAGPPVERDAAVDAGMDSSMPAEDAGADTGVDAEVDAGSDALVPLGFRVTDTMPTADAPVQQLISGALSVTFSDPVDQASVTSSTMTVSGDGRPIAGSVATTARGATFTPSTPWMLAGKYTLKLTSGIKSADDEALEAFSFDFTIRDGEWTRKAEFDGLGDPVVALASDGFGVLEWSHDTGATPEILASTYDPTTGFSASAQLTSQGQGTSVAAANVRHSAIAVWSGISAGQNSSLFTATGGWTTGYGVSPGAAASVALSDSDEVFYVASSTANSNALTGYQYTIGAANPQPISVGSTATGNTEAQLVVLGGVGHLAWIHSAGGANNQMVTGTLDGTLGTDLTMATKHNSNPRMAATRTHASAILVWQQDDPSMIGDDTIWASRKTTMGAWSMPVQISKGTGAAVSPAVALDDHGRGLVTWQQGGVLKSANFDPGAGWSNPVTISASDAMNPDPASVGVQPDGTGMAVWTQDNPVDALNEVWFARYLVGSGWQAASIARISDNDAGTGSVVSLSVDNAGRALAAWYQSNKVWVGRFK